MKPRFLNRVVPLVAFIALSAACTSVGPDDARSSSPEKSAADGRPLQSYLLAEADFPTGTTWKRLDPTRMDDVTTAPDAGATGDLECRRRAADADLAGGELDGVVARHGASMVTQLVARPQIEPDVIIAAMSGRCADQKLATEGQVRVRFAQLRPEVPGVLLFSQTVVEGPNERAVSESLLAYVNRDDVTISVTETSIRLSTAAPIDQERFLGFVKRAVQLAEKE